jgi:ABC-type transport system involved in cytochrome bd biosynthesis fused ATPase/permease subunit
MWRLRKSGFHLYTLAQLLVLLITVLFLGRGALSLGSVMFTLLFVVYYYIALRNLGVFNKATEQQENSDNNSDNLTE